MGLLPEKCRIFARASEIAASGRLWRVLGVAGFGECCEPQGQARIRCEVGAEPGLITCWTYRPFGMEVEEAEDVLVVYIMCIKAYLVCVESRPLDIVVSCRWC